MAIIPFIIGEKENDTVMTEPSKFDQQKSKICIVNLDKSQLEDENDSNASYDLRIGATYRDHRKNETVNIKENQDITLKSGAAIIIKTAEEVHFPNNRFGQILPKVGLLHQGVSNTTSKVDPGYRGFLTITLFNLGKETIILKKNEKFCTLVIQEVATGTIPYQKESKSIPNSDMKTPLLKVVKTVTTENSTIITIIISLVAIIVAFVK